MCDIAAIFLSFSPTFCQRHSVAPKFFRCPPEWSLLSEPFFNDHSHWLLSMNLCKAYIHRIGFDARVRQHGRKEWRMRHCATFYSPVRFTPAVGVTSGAHYRTSIQELLHLRSPQKSTDVLGTPSDSADAVFVSTQFTQMSKPNR